ncbi:MAG: tRNA (N(6)-L-threonylcarbamoyladenosine(37)-C(2))-methylthiotransferase MtaB [Lachnospiraceae bacterium]
MRKAAFHNLGCKVNSYETEAMQQLLEHAGYEIVPFQEGADVYVINTCSVTNIADRKSRQMLHRAKKMNPDAVVVAAGCYVQAAGEALKKDEAIDIVIGNNKKVDLPAILEEYFACQSEQETVIDISQTKEYEPLKIEKIEDHTRAFLKVQDGCNQFCSYCIIPYTRGRARSRSIGDVVEEVEKLAAAGYQEIVLTGIHLTSYGIDFPEGEKETLLGLILRLHEIDGIKRIRMGSLEPRVITPEFAHTLAGLPKICPHFHLSLQSGCDATLKRMNRHYTTKDYLERCDLLREAFGNPAITTDVIVGFPGETQEEFETTRAFLEQVGFYEMHVFKYSRRQGTRAAVMEDQVPESVKADRSDVLMELDRNMSKHYREQFLGKEVQALMEEKLVFDQKEYLIGHTKEYIKVVIPYEEGRKGTTVTGTLQCFLNDEILLLSENDRKF